jgi:hypothetical protein
VALARSLAVMESQLRLFRESLERQDSAQMRASLTDARDWFDGAPIETGRVTP